MGVKSHREPASARRRGLVSSASWRAAQRRLAQLLGAAPEPCSSTRMESLEGRLLLAVHPVITEFMADNANGRTDAFGSHSDWIEIYNPAAAPLDLTGYYLTDDITDLTKWKFPAMALGANDYVVVAASNRNLADPAQELHTNFELSASGEYLALVAPDGTTVVSDYRPAYPNQLPDTSYGRTVSVGTDALIGASATVRVLVPADGGLSTETWTAADFDDAGWRSGFAGVGYDRGTNIPNPPSGFNVRMVDTNGGTDGQFSNIGEAQSLMNGTLPAGSFTVVYDNRDSLKNYSVINFGGAGGAFGSDKDLPNGAKPTDSTLAAGREQYALRATAYVFIPAGTWTVDVGSDEGFMLTLPGVTFSEKINQNFTGTPFPGASDTFVYGARRSFGHTQGIFTAPAGGIYTTLTLDYYERTDADLLELSVASGTRRSFDSSAFSLLSDGSPAGWRVKTDSMLPPPGYDPLIKTDIEGEMFGKNPSAYLRMPFSTPIPEDYDTLILRVRYDDGFVAYINGQEVARRNAPEGAPAWDAAATADRPVNEGLVYESIAIDVTSGMLRKAGNVLAIQGLNDSAGSGDFFIQAELDGTRVAVGADRYFQNPTPDKPNDVSGSAEAVADTKFNQDRGFYSQPFDLVISTATVGAQIRYTIDGTLPTATTGTVYTGPIRIAKTTTIRAAAFKPGMISTNVDTQTYLFPDDILLQSPNGQAPGAGWPNPGSINGQIINYGMDPTIIGDPVWKQEAKAGLTSIPTFSIVMKLDDLFNPSTGFYVNPGGDGRPWERMASIELINPDGSGGFQIDGGVRVRGGFSRSGDNPKHGIRLFFRNEPGYGGKLHYKMFGDDGANVFEQFDLRTSQNYSWSFQGDSRHIALRDQINRDLQEATGQATARGNFYHLYINGVYWGLFDTDERASASNAAELYGGDESEYDVIKVDPDLGYNIEATEGDMNAWTDMWTQVRGDMTNIANYYRVQGRNPDGTRNPAYPELIDVDNLIDYMLVIYYGGNLDAPLSAFIGNTSPNNFFAVRNRNGTSGGFKFYIHDAEHTFLNAGEDRTGPFYGVTSVGKSNPQSIFELMARSPEFKLRVADRIHKHFFNNGAMTPTTVASIINRRKAEIYTAIVDESARWGDSKREPAFTRDDWNRELTSILNSFVPSRTNTVLSQLKGDGLYPSVAAPEFNQNGGVISNAFMLYILNPGGSGRIYYTTDGTDPRLAGGAINPAALIATAPVSLKSSSTVKARIRLDNGTWSALTEATFTVDLSSIRISELMYHPAPPPAGSPWTAEDFEFIELTNAGSRLIDLTDLHFTAGIDFTFPKAGLVPGQRLLVVANRAAFESRYGTGRPIVGEFANNTRLSDTDGHIAIALAGADPILDFTFQPTWYPITDGGGYSLVMVDPMAKDPKLNDKDTWRPSFNPDGAPGEMDAGYAPGSISANEVMPWTDDPRGDWVEFYNANSSAVDLSGWFLSDDASNLTKYRIPDGTFIGARGYLVFNQAQHFGNPATATVPFSLNEAGGNIYLTSRDPLGRPGGYRDAQDFDAAEKEVTIGRIIKSNGHRDFTALSAPTQAAPNAAPRVGPVVVDEIMYNPALDNLEFIELRNLTGSEIALADGPDAARAWRLSDGVDFTFPEGAFIPAFGFVLIVPVTPAEFRSRYVVPAEAQVYGPYVGKLDNAGEDVTLSRPGGAGGLVRVDRVRYNNKSPWPTSPDGKGPSLVKVIASGYGNDPINWGAGDFNGSPGAPNNQEPPSVDGGDEPVLNIGDTFTRTFWIYDPNAQQTWTAIVDWGDKSPVQTLPVDQVTRKFTLSRQFIAAGTYMVKITVTDSAGGIGVTTLPITVLPRVREGSNSSENYTLRLDPTGAYVQFFENVPINQPPTLYIRRSLLPRIVINANGGSDTLRVDFSYGNPIPDGGLEYNGGDGDDMVRLDFNLGNPMPQGEFKFNGNAGNDALILAGSQNDDHLWMSNAELRYETFTISRSGFETLYIQGGPGNDTLTVTEALAQAPNFFGGGGNDTLALTAGTYTFTSDFGEGSTALTVVASGSTQVTFAESQRLGGIEVRDDARVNLAAGGTRVLRTSGIRIGGNGSLDIADNSLILQAPYFGREEELRKVSELLRTGRNGGRWNGAGLVSSTAASDARRLTGLAAILNDDGLGNPLREQFGNQPVDTTCILIGQTWNGDVDMSGTLTADDYTIMDHGFANKESGFARGDADYSGTIDADDYFLLDRAYLALKRMETSSAAAAPLAARAEPAVTPVTAATKKRTDAREDQAVPVWQRTSKIHKRGHRTPRHGTR